MSKQIVGLVAQQKGGTGKTTFTDILNATCQAAGQEVLVVDVDDGNSGFIRRCGKGSALSLSWSHPAGGAAEWVGRHLDGNDVVLLDLGANLFASGAPVTQFLAEVVTHLQTTGARLMFFAIASTNSPGCGRLVTDMRNDFGSLGEVRLVENNVDGSGEFPREIGTLGMKRIELRHIDAGLQAARLLRQEPLLDVLSRPTAEYELAMARYAKILLDFAEQEAVVDIVGSDALGKLRLLAEHNPSGLYFMVRTLAQAENDTIQANLAYGRTYRALNDVNTFDRDAVYDKALAFIAAAKAYSSK